MFHTVSINAGRWKWLSLWLKRKFRLRLHELLFLQWALSFYSKEGGRLQGTSCGMESSISTVLCSSQSFQSSNFILISMVPAYFCVQFENSVQTLFRLKVKLEGVADTEFGRHRLSWSGMKHTRTQQWGKTEDGPSPRTPSLAAAWGQYFRDRISGGGFELDSIFYSSKLLLGNHIIWVQLLKSFQCQPCSLRAFSSGVFVE